MRGEPLSTLTSGGILQRARDAVEATRDAVNTDAGWIAALDALTGLTRADALQVAATLAVLLGRAEVLQLQGPGEVAEPMEGTDP